MSTFEPKWISPPGESIADLLQAKGMTLASFSRALNQPMDEVRRLIEGRVALTVGMSRSLADILGGSVEFWMAREYQYLEDLNRLCTESKGWLDNLPTAEMVKYGWIEKTRSSADTFRECLHFFAVSSVQAWQVKYRHLGRALAFRTSPAYQSSIESVAAWVRRGEIEALDVQCASWDPVQLRAILPEVRALTRIKDPQRFLPKLQGLFATAGVVIVVLRAPSRCRASGVARFLSSQKALVLLSGRYRSDDHFWFTLFHEVAHLLLHDREGVFIDDLDEVPDFPIEREANTFAEALLIPDEHVPELLELRANSKQVIRFARRIGVSTGVVVGQLQHRNLIRRNQLNKLKRRYDWA